MKAILVTISIVFGVSIVAKVFVNKIYKALKAILKGSNLTEVEQMRILDRLAEEL